MNGRLRVRLGLILFLVAGSCRCGLAATLPPDVRTTANGAAAKPAIDKFIAGVAAGLTSDDPSAQSQARDAIAAEVASGGAPPVTPSPAFFEVYAQAVNDVLLPIAQQKDAHMRLNAAVTAARVAEKAKNQKLAPVITSFMADDAPAVVLWGVKAAKYVLPSVLSGPGGKTDPFFVAFLAAAKKNIKDGPIMQSVYESLRNDDVMNNVTPPLAWSAMAATVVGSMQDLVAARLDIYVQQGVPEMPLVDTIATGFLTATNVYPSVKTLQLQTMQTCINLISLDAQRLAAAAGQTNDQHDLVEAITRIAKGITVATTSADAKDAVKELTRLQASAPGTDAGTQADQAYAKLAKIPEFTGLKPPPKIAE